MPSPNGSQGGDNTLIQVSAGTATSAWAVGYAGAAGNFRTLAERWNGAKWVLVRSPNPSRLDNVLYGVANLSPASAWAVGYDSVNVSPIAYHRALIEHWNGSTWRVVPTPKAGPSDSDLWGVAALSATDAWAVGNVNIGTFPTFRFRPLVEHWDGAHWGLIPAPTAGSAQLSRISMLTPGDGWAVGIRGAVSHTQALVEHWDGHRWTTAASPVIPGSGLADVLALGPHLAWAVGSYSPRTGANRTLIERWNGRAWTLAPSPNRRPSSELLGIAGTRQHLWAVGGSLTSTTSTLILRH